MNKASLMDQDHHNLASAQMNAYGNQAQGLSRDWPGMQNAIRPLYTPGSEYYRTTVWDAEATQELRDRTRQRQQEAFAKLLAEGKSVLTRKEPYTWHP